MLNTERNCRRLLNVRNRSSDTAVDLIVIATRVSSGFRYSVRVGSKDYVQMDGSRARCVLLLLAGDFCSLANCGGDICRAN